MPAAGHAEAHAFGFFGGEDQVDLHIADFAGGLIENVRALGGDADAVGVAGGTGEGAVNRPHAWDDGGVGGEDEVAEIGIDGGSGDIGGGDGQGRDGEEGGAGVADLMFGFDADAEVFADVAAGEGVFFEGDIAAAGGDFAGVFAGGVVAGVPGDDRIGPRCRRDRYRS